MKRKLLLYPLLCVALLGVAQTPKQVVEQSIQKLKKSAYLAHYQLSVLEKNERTPHQFKGTILLYGEKFYLEYDEIKVWYNGKTQWVYMDAAEELTISNPTNEEAAQMNPMLMLQELLADSQLSFSSAHKSADNHVVDFVPNKTQNDILRLTLFINRTTQLPTSLQMRQRNGIFTTLALTQIKEQPRATEALFECKMSDYPDAFIVDLR